VTKELKNPSDVLNAFEEAKASLEIIERKFRTAMNMVTIACLLALIVPAFSLAHILSGPQGAGLIFSTSDEGALSNDP